MNGLANEVKELVSEYKTIYADWLPEDVIILIAKYEHSLELSNKGTPDFRLDCYTEELKSDINVLEVSNQITSSQAWFLREKHLGIVQGEF